MAIHISKPPVVGDALTPDALSEVKLDVAAGGGVGVWLMVVMGSTELYAGIYQYCSSIPP